MSGKITVVGLGSGSVENLSLGVYRKLKNSKHNYLRTKAHPVVDFLEQEGISFETFDYLYDTLDKYDEVYLQIASVLLDKAEEGQSPFYAVPGNPMVAEKSVQHLLEKAPERNVEINILGGESFLDTVFSRLHVDPIDGFIFLNGETISHEQLDPKINTVIGQVYNQWVASDVKLSLMEVYPDEMLLYIVSYLGIEGKEEIKEIPLYELDHHADDFHHLSSLFIPKSSDTKVYERQFSRLVEIVEILRSPNGCPWDRAQTHQSIRKNAIEEMYEFVETIDELDFDHMVEELGDVLLQVMLHAQIAEEEGYFNIFDVVQQINQKLVRRHPHVFGDQTAEKAEEALQHWDKIKQQEKEKRGEEQSASVLDGVPKDLPAVLKAYTLQKKASKVGFDWSDSEDIFAKIQEEFQEVKQASEEEKMGELGDLLFAVVNLARFMKVDPEAALTQTNHKFIKRFHYIEKKLKEDHVPIDEASLDVMEHYWNEAKKDL